MQTHKIRKIIIFLTSIFLITSTTITIGQTTTNPTTLYVGGTGPYNFTTIQAAIDFADNGDTIYVYNGTYNERLNIIKNLIIIGENKTTTIIDGNNIGDVIFLNTNQTTIHEFTIQHGGIDGIDIRGNNNTITNNIIINNQRGISLVTSNSKDNLVYDNNISDNSLYGIYLTRNTTQNHIYQNTLTFNNCGINIYNANYSKFYHNDFISNTINANDPNNNFWNKTIYPQMGNYWDDYTGTDADDNGIGDTPYPIPGGTNHDHFPLMHPFGTPIAHFTYTINNMTVDFDGTTSQDPDGTITNYTWEFGDNTIGYGPTIQHTYPTTKTYTVNLTITDNTALTDTYSQTFLLNTPPYTPSNPNPTNTSTGHCTINLSWTGGDPNPMDTITYDLYFGITTPPPMIINNQTTTYYEPTSLTPCTTYYWQIISWDNHGASTPGPIWHFRTNCPPNTPNTPYPSNQSTDVSATTHLSWNATDPDTQPLTYNIYLGTTSPPPLIKTNETNSTYTPDTLDFDTTYYWQITATDPCNTTTASPIWTFTTAPYYRVPDLDCVGSLSWIKIPPGSIQHGAFTILNIGEAHSQLNWYIESTPTWGTWNITPDYGLGLTPQHGPIVINVTVTAPDLPRSDFTGNIKVINLEDPTDYELIPVTLTTPKPQFHTLIHQFITLLQERFPLLHTILATILSLR